MFVLFITKVIKIVLPEFPVVVSTDELLLVAKIYSVTVKETCPTRVCGISIIFYSSRETRNNYTFKKV